MVWAVAFDMGRLPHSQVLPGGPAVLYQASALLAVDRMLLVCLALLRLSSAAALPSPCHGAGQCCAKRAGW